MEYMYLFLSILFGLIFGSYASMVSYRLIHEKVDNIRSICVHCKHALSFLDLMPLLSYILLRGKCRYCNAGISLRYPIIELSLAILFVLNFYIIGYESLFKLLIIDGLTVILLIIIVCDLEDYIIPDTMLFWMFGFGIVYGYIMHYSWVQLFFMPIMLLLLAMIIKAVTELFVKKVALGYGDVKFFFVSGVFLSPHNISSFLVLSGIAGIIMALVWRKFHKTDIFPFGPSLCVSLYLILLFNMDISKWLI